MVNKNKTAQKYRMPRGMRYSNLVDRTAFYCNEFDPLLVEKWMSFRKNTVFSFLIGKYTKIYLKKFENIKDDVVVVDDYCDMRGLIEYILRYLPEGVYYDTNYYEDLDICRGCPLCYETKKCIECKHYIGQELVFDLDPENVYCPIHGDLNQKMKLHQGRALCMIEFKIVRTFAEKMYYRLAQNYAKIQVIYSGRGFHLHVLDDDTKYLTREEKSKLAREYGQEFPIDEWVTAGGIKLIRLPYSLHGMVSRICTPVNAANIKNFNPLHDLQVIPKFIRYSY
jgi:DNA primase catalytic subunit